MLLICRTSAKVSSQLIHYAGLQSPKRKHATQLSYVKAPFNVFSNCNCHFPLPMYMYLSKNKSKTLDSCLLTSPLSQSDCVKQIKELFIVPF